MARSTAAIAVLAFLGGANAFINDWVLTQVEPLVIGRMDPIMAPGKADGHVHWIAGGSNFRSVLNTPEEQQRGACSTTNIQADKSNYWIPLTYFINKDGEYETMDVGARIYYHAENAVPWPLGMRVISGIGNVRSPDSKAAQGIFWGCHDLGGGQMGTNPNRMMPNGTTNPSGCGNVQAGVAFPSCGWANQSLDSWDHWSHLTWPMYSGGGASFTEVQGYECPPSHPIKYPSIFFELTYFPSEKQRAQWRPNEINLILSNGDTTGYSLHADFVNGWDPKVLQDAIDHCTGPNQVNDKPEKCSAFSAHIKDQSQCRYQGMVPAEPVGLYKPLKTLPGCNKPWGINDPPQKPKECPADFKRPGFVSPMASRSSWYGAQVVPVADDFGDIVINKTSRLEEKAGVVGGNNPWIFSWPPVGRSGDGSYPRGSGESLNADSVWPQASQKDYFANTDVNTAQNKVDAVFQQQDSTAWDDKIISGPPTNKHRVKQDLPKVTVTYMTNAMSTGKPDEYWQVHNPEVGQGIPPELLTPAKRSLADDVKAHKRKRRYH